MQQATQTVIIMGGNLSVPVHALSVRTDCMSCLGLEDLCLTPFSLLVHARARRCRYVHVQVRACVRAPVALSCQPLVPLPAVTELLLTVTASSTPVGVLLSASATEAEYGTQFSYHNYVHWPLHFSAREREKPLRGGVTGFCQPSRSKSSCSCSSSSCS